MRGRDFGLEKVAQCQSFSPNMVRYRLPWSHSSLIRTLRRVGNAIFFILIWLIILSFFYFGNWTCLYFLRCMGFKANNIIWCSLIRVIMSKNVELFEVIPFLLEFLEKFKILFIFFSLFKEYFYGNCKCLKCSFQKEVISF